MSTQEDLHSNRLRASLKKLRGKPVRSGPCFRELIAYLADSIGQHQVPIQEHAHNIHELLGADGVHHELVTRIVRALYKANHCGHLDAPISAEVTLSTVGQIRAECMQSSKADIDQIRLLDELGVRVCGYLGTFPIPTSGDRTSKLAGTRQFDGALAKRVVQISVSR